MRTKIENFVKTCQYFKIDNNIYKYAPEIGVMIELRIIEQTNQLLIVARGTNQLVEYPIMNDFMFSCPIKEKEGQEGLTWEEIQFLLNNYLYFLH